MSEVRYVLMGEAERLYTEYRDDGTLTDPTSPFVRIYTPTGTVLDSGIPTKESTGVYYYTVTVTTASTSKEGSYQAYWKGTIGSANITMDTPQYFYATRIPWQITEPDAIINSIRRMIGDTNPTNYRIATQDLYYFFKDAIDEVQADYPFGYVLTVTNTLMTWNKTLYSTPFVLFKMRTLILVMESLLHDCLYDGGKVDVGDIKVDVTGILKLRMQNLERLRKEYAEMMYQVKTNGEGYIIDTHAVGLINNTSGASVYSYE